MAALSLPAVLVLALGLFGVSSAQDTASAWRRVEEAPAGSPQRARLLLGALEAAPDEPLGERLQLAWSIGVEAARDLRLEDAIAIQSKLAARHPADWSAMDLALSLGLAGRPLEADLALERALVRARAEGRPTAELWNRRGLLWLGAGRERPARDHLGRALAQGSADAAVVLARLELSRGDLAAARAGFRSRLYDDPPGAWALRGWGLSLLPPIPEPAPEQPEEPTP